MIPRRRWPALVLGLVLVTAPACAVDDPATAGRAADAPAPAASAAPTPAGASASDLPPSSAAPSRVPTPPVATPTAVDPRGARIQQVMQAKLEAGWYPNAIVGVWSPQGSWVGTVGTNGSEPMRRDLHVRIGSITKTFTTTLLLQLAEEGTLSLEDPVSKYLDHIPNGHATLRQLADMTSGIPSYTDLPTFTADDARDHRRTWQPAEIVAYLSGQPGEFPPGAAFHYSNTNTVLLGMVLEKVTGRPLADLMQERLLTPLGLAETSFPRDATLPAPWLRGITDDGIIGNPPRDATNDSPSNLWAAGQMVSTVDDLHTWAVALATGKGILKDATQKARIDSLGTTVPGNGAAWSYGIGFRRANGWIGHLGEVNGYTADINHKPETQTTVVVLVGSNIYAENVERPAQALFAVIAPLLA